MNDRLKMSYSKIQTRTLFTVCLFSLVAQGAQAWLFNRSETGSTPEAHGRYRQRVAVCVGINRYESHPKLNCAENDAAEMARVFRDFGFDDVTLLLGSDATRETILNTLHRAKDGLSSSDLFVFYFAGHGMTVRQGSADLMGYLLPVNCRAKNEADDGISMGILKELTDSLPSRHSLFLMDACYSGYGLSKGVARAAGFEGNNDPCVQILTAGGELDRAFESNGHGLFTGHLLDSLEGIDRKGKGAITGTELAKIVKQKVSSETGGWQTPQFGTAGGGDVVLVKRRPVLADQVAMAR